jgi:histidinol-phosphate aminotransferase
VLQTLSKARGLAGLRIGIAFANSLIIEYLSKIKLPYNISSTNQQIALKRLNDERSYRKEIETILTERKRVAEALDDCRAVKKVYLSEANFILVEVDNADRTYEELIEREIVVRNRSKQVENCLRITIGKPDENDCLISAFNNEISH